MEQEYMFESTSHALTWATENMRRRMFPKISSIYKESGSKVAATSDTWRMHNVATMPNDAEEVRMLSSKIFACLKQMEPEIQHIIILKYWGDFHEKHHLEMQLKLLENLRQQGQRVRLNYRYSVRQVADKMCINYRTLHRRLVKAEDNLAVILRKNGLLMDGYQHMCHKTKPATSLVQ